ncbi:hypothetical protein [Xanthobacter agilis]|uniref:hypothetical protein n=1 Tax=Xanthobacter agilis TaxID=47492 RepID=UPI00372B2775
MEDIRNGANESGPPAHQVPEDPQESTPPAAEVSGGHPPEAPDVDADAPKATADVFVLTSDGPRKVDVSVLDLAALKAMLSSNIDALRAVQWALPRLLHGPGAAKIPFDERARFAEMVRTTGSVVQMTLEAAGGLFDTLPDPAPQTPETSEGTEGDAPLSLQKWRAAMAAPAERVADLALKVGLLQAVEGAAEEWAHGVAQILLDVELLGRSALAPLPIYEEHAQEVDLAPLHGEWLALRAQAGAEGLDFDAWALAMSNVVHRLMTAPAWTAGGRRLKHEVLRHELSVALADADSKIDPRCPMWLSALEVDAARAGG